MKLIFSPLSRANLLFKYALLLLSCSSVIAEQLSLQNTSTQMVQGGVGLIQMPTARMAPDGSFRINYTDNDQYRFSAVSLQFFPWMESTIRYTDVRTRLYSSSQSFSGDQTYKDKGLDVKFRLTQESYYIPELSLGFKDIGGTGLFDSEFIAASKRAGPFDFHLGLGWGYLGTANNITNPFCRAAARFCTRANGVSGNGGTVEYNKFFSGNAAIFGGMEYVTPIKGLIAKLEYEGKNYIDDFAGNLPQETPWNMGLVYKWNNFDVSLNYQRGNTVGFGVTYNMNLHTIRQVKIDEPPRSLEGTQGAVSMQMVDRQRLYNDLSDNAGFYVTDIDESDDKIIFYGSQDIYRDTDESIQRIGRVIASELPDDIHEYHIVETEGGIPLLETTIDADAFKAAARLESLENDITRSYHQHNPSKKVREGYEPADNSGMFFNVDTFWVQTFGNPEAFYLYQGGLFLSGGYAFNNHLFMQTTVKATLIENFDEFNFKVDALNTPLPRVRTYAREYVTRSQVMMESATLNWFDQIANNTYAQAYAGYLEGMFGGIGSEIMYRPVNSNLYFGLDLNYVKQRSFENDWEFMDYTAFTGHASAYWQPSFLPGTQITASVGQFLAQDKGVNIDFAKRFDSGIIVGAFAAFTNVSAEEYGEGSFTKGFYLSIPFDLFVIEPAKGRGNFPWIPIARDGGQKLVRPNIIKNITEIRSPFYD